MYLSDITKCNVCNLRCFTQSDNSCRLQGRAAMYQTCLNWTEILGIWRPGQHFELFIMFFKLFLNNVSSVARCIIPLKESTLTREHHCYKGV